MHTCATFSLLLLQRNRCLSARLKLACIKAPPLPSHATAVSTNPKLAMGISSHCFCGRGRIGDLEKEERGWEWLCNCCRERPVSLRYAFHLNPGRRAEGGIFALFAGGYFSHSLIPFSSFVSRACVRPKAFLTNVRLLRLPEFRRMEQHPGYYNQKKKTLCVVDTTFALGQECMNDSRHN